MRLAPERCPSGRRSSTGNAVTGLNPFAGSNPALSVKACGNFRDDEHRMRTCPIAAGFLGLTSLVAPFARAADAPPQTQPQPQEPAPTSPRPGSGGGAPPPYTQIRWP